jgi:hypothetical protein
MKKSKLNSEKIWKIQKKSKLNSEKIGKMWKKGKLNSEKIWKVWKKPKLNCEKKQALTVMISPLCTNCHDITVILLNVALNTINLIFYLQRHIPTYLFI